MNCSCVKVFYYVLNCHANIVPSGTTLADLGGRPGARPPYGTQFFRFRIHFNRKVPTSEVHAPPTGSPGSATGPYVMVLELY